MKLCLPKPGWPKLIFLMRVSLLNLIIALCTMQVLMARHAAGQGLEDINVTVELKNGDIKTLFEKIEKQTKLRFAYDPTLIRPYTDISLPRETRSIKATLDLVLEGTPLRYRQVDNSVIIYIELGEKISEVEPIQGVLVTGSVKEASTQEPLPGVNIIQKGTIQGTTTDADGRYSLFVAEDDAILVFSFIGYTTQEVALNGRSVIDVMLLEDVQSLDEVVVIGYGTQNRKDVTGSVSSVKASDFNKGVFTDANQLIQGKAAGVVITRPGGNPNANSSVRLRGVNSLTGSNTPLYVIDGVVGVDINTISPNDIASFDIMKDAATASIYGARAANGVIIVTTKKGSGRKSQVDYMVSLSVETLSNYLKLTSAQDIRDYQKSIGNTTYTDKGANTDWLKAVARTSYSQNHSLSLSGGTEKTTYRASVNYLDKPGIILGTALNRFSGNININHLALNDRLTISLNLLNQQTFNEFGNVNNVFLAIADNDPSEPIRNPDGSFNNFFIFRSGNAVSMATDIINNNRQNVLRGTISGNLKITKNLSGTIVSTYESDSYNRGYFEPSNSIAGIRRGGIALATRSFAQNRVKQLEAYFNYKPTISDQHNFDIVGGYAYNYHQNEGFGSTGYSFVSDLFTYNNLGASQDRARMAINSANFSYALARFFARANYNFKEKYYLTAGLVREGSSRFGQNNRYANFPSVSAAWRLSNEPFLQGIGWLDDLKFKVSYGQSGNLPPDSRNLEYLSTYGNVGFGYVGGQFLPTYGPVRNPNPDLKWETQSSLNTGFDFSLFSGRVNGSIEYYYNKTSDLLYTYSVPSPPNVFGQTYANVGSMRNAGVDLQITGAIVDKANFGYTLSVAGALNRNKVLSISNSQYEIAAGFIETGFVSGDGEPGFSQRIEEGKPIGSFYMYNYAGLTPDGRLLFKNTTGELVTTDAITNKDRQYVDKYAIPPYTLGLNHSFRYKNWNLNLFFNGSFGNTILNGTYWNLAQLSRLPTKPVPKDFIEKGIKQTDVYLSSLWLEDGSYLRLQNTALSYNVKIGPQSKYIKAMQVGLLAENLLLFTNYKGVDPEVAQSDIFTNIGIDNRNYYPKTRAFILQVQASF